MFEVPLFDVPCTPSHDVSLGMILNASGSCKANELVSRSRGGGRGRRGLRGGAALRPSLPWGGRGGAPSFTAVHYGEEGRRNAPSAVVVCHGEEGAPHLPSPLCAIVRRELRALPPCAEPWGGSGGGFAMTTVGARGRERRGWGCSGQKK